MAMDGFLSDPMDHDIATNVVTQDAEYGTPVHQERGYYRDALHRGTEAWLIFVKARLLALNCTRGAIVDSAVLYYADARSDPMVQMLTAGRNDTPACSDVSAVVSPQFSTFVTSEHKQSDVDNDRRTSEGEEI
ncbi:hypothetical protein SPBR_05231 [Sporothrix brasiliensis 5110]|uniref:Uncharacterized protein n=1 Tax=Sporothrix brasiliensis 5110 TaxID=1398154 RepID=A0A0C2ENS3_9PEZI|nr:uncharacterized protein SPBR_05231 [Sporothrix brasiliensis 5110]KIH87779.1 hypothetical protein SPBR_05231 [Sporothrix brasiliensis 5110]